MARYRFGKSEDLKCIEEVQKFEIQAPEGEIEVCYAAKISTQSLILPVRIKVDSYVLATDSNKFYDLSSQQIKYQQIIGNLPDPLPTYDLTSSDIFWGSFGIYLLPLAAIYFVIALFTGEESKDEIDKSTDIDMSKE